MAKLFTRSLPRAARVAPTQAIVENGLDALQKCFPVPGIDERNSRVVSGHVDDAAHRIGHCGKARRHGFQQHAAKHLTP